MLGTIEVLKHRRERPLVTVVLFFVFCFFLQLLDYFLRVQTPELGNGSLFSSLLHKPEVWSSDP